MEPSWLNPLPLVAILRGVTPESVVDVGAVLANAGFHILEIPLNSPEPFESIRRLSDALGKECLVGAGTVLRVEDVTAVANHGGRLIVMPHTDPAIIAAAKRAHLVCVPGTATPSEAFAALAAGADAIKIFPAEQIMPAVLRAWRAVLPRDVAILPVGGITPRNMADYVAAGASGFGVGSALYKAGRPLDAIAQAAQQFVHGWASITQGQNPQ